MLGLICIHKHELLSLVKYYFNSAQFNPKIISGLTLNALSIYILVISHEDNSK